MNQTESLLEHYIEQDAKLRTENAELKKANADLIEQIDIDFNYQKHLIAQLTLIKGE